MSIINWFCHMYTNAMPPNTPFAHSRIISLLDYVALIPNFQFISGITSFHK